MQASTRWGLVFGTAFAATASTLGCGREGTSAPHAKPGVSTPAAPGASPALRATGGATAADPKQALPADVPSYPGARVVRSSGASEQGLLIAFQSQDTPEKVFEFYRQKLAEQGWSMEGEMSSADQRMLIAGKGDRKASVLVSADEGGQTEITLTLTRGEG
ncbi:MAG TPA: hypothetical protein VKE73_08565 [Myxococcota bacterium]|nr:hypothetical protein [Myxococcota bacterium]